MNKTLIGKNGYLFLTNDSGRELEVHCNNLNLVKYEDLKKYNFNNFCLVVFPNKSLIYKQHLPDNYDAKYRPAFDIYRNVLKNKIIDTHDVLKKEDDVYYKTDTHINTKGNYIVYKHFIHQLNKMYNLHIEPKEITVLNKKCVLPELNIGKGDLLWKLNLGEQIVEDHTDTFYYSNEVEYIYATKKIQTTDEIRILNYNLIDQNSNLHGSILDWNVISNYILYKKNNSKNKQKILIFYDSFLLELLTLYLDLFEEVYMVKNNYDNNLINIIKPDFVFEFRVERFLS
jgi:hypothetical protein